ncbi:MAG: sensor histidine kinase [Thermoplasmatota archaeon]
MTWNAATPGPRSLWVRWTLVALLWAAYFALRLAAPANLAPGMVPLAVLPIMAGAWLLGWRAGAAIVVGLIPVAVLIDASGTPQPFALLLQADGIRWGVGIALGGAAGWGAEIMERHRQRTITLRSEIAVREAVEEETRRKLAEYRALADNSPDLISRFDIHRKRIFANRSVEALLGRPHEELVGGRVTQDMVAGLQAKAVDRLSAAMDEVFRRKRPVTVELPGPTLHGPGLFETRILPEFSLDGTVSTLLVVSRDITQERAAAAQLAVAHETLRAIIDSSPMAMVHGDPDGTVRLWNAAAERLFGWTAAEVVGGPDPSMPERDLPLEAASRLRLDHEATVVRQDAKRTAKDGTPIPVDAYLSPIRAPDGTPHGVVTLFVDLRERNRAKEGDELKALQAVRQRFLNAAAHELNTPLTPIRLMVSSLQRRLGDRLSEPERAGFTLIERNLERFTQLVQDLLDATRLEGGNLHMRRQPVHIDALTSYVFHSFEAEAQADGITFTAGAEAVEVEGDESRLVQVLVNLVHNALKFTPRGGRVAVEARGARDGVDIQVSDSGIGMLPGDAARIFQPFLRLEAAAATPGTGLGLFICKGIVEQHGGQITVSSAGPGQGTTFRIHLPAHAPLRVAAPAAA